MRKRVVVTGLGIVSPLGNDLETAWTACRSGRSGIGLITRFDASDLKTHIAGEVRNFEIPSVIPAKDAKKMDVLDLYAIAATQQALDDAGLKITDDIADDVGVSLGVGIGGEVTLEKKCAADGGEGARAHFTILRTDDSAQYGGRLCLSYLRYAQLQCGDLIGLCLFKSRHRRCFPPY